MGDVEPVSYTHLASPSRAIPICTVPKTRRKWCASGKRPSSRTGGWANRAGRSRKKQPGGSLGNQRGTKGNDYGLILVSGTIRRGAS